MNSSTRPLKNVIESERQLRRDRLSDLENIYNDQDSEVRRVRTAIKNMADEFGAIDPEILKASVEGAAREATEGRCRASQLQGQILGCRAAIEEIEKQVSLKGDGAPSGEDRQELHRELTRQKLQKIARGEELSAAEEFLAAATAKMKKLGNGAIELEISREKMKHHEATLKTVHEELQRLRLEIRLPGDVTLLQRAEIIGNNDTQRRMMAGLAAGAAFLVVFLLATVSVYLVRSWR